MSNVVITLHDVNDATWLENTIKYLKRKYTFISSTELINYYYNDKKLKNSCLITVDDGALSSYEVIYPILKKYNIPAIFFVSPEITKRERATNFWFQEIFDYDMEKMRQIARKYIESLDIKTNNVSDSIDNLTIDNIWKAISEYRQLYSITPKEPQNMTIQQIVQIDKEGLVEIGAHTLWHPFLANETDQRSKEEIQSSVNQLEAILQHPILTFAYPNGRPALDWGEREIEYLKETSVKIAFSTYHNKFSLSNNAHAIPRYGLTSGSGSFIRLKLFLGRYYPIAKRVSSCLAIKYK